MSRFTPVSDPERARCEQDEESLRKHRQFDTPFALLGKDLNDKSKPKRDGDALARPSGDMELDEHQLWRKKNELFEKKKTWGRETMEYSNPEQARAEGNKGPQWGRPGTVGWGVRGNFGGKGEDTGTQVLQRGEVNQEMVKNEKGLWVRKKAVPDEAPVRSDKWKCKCGELVTKREHHCNMCGAPRPESSSRKHLVATNDDLRPAQKGEDPRLEAAKQKGRGTADAAQQALKALEERRRMEHHVKEEVGMMRRRHLDGTQGVAGGKLTTLNSSSQQVKPAARHKKYTNWQGVQHNVDEAKKVVGKALGYAQIGNTSSIEKKEEVNIASTTSSTDGRKGTAEDLTWRADSPSPPRSRSRSPAPRERWDGTVEVDFF